MRALKSNHGLKGAKTCVIFIENAEELNFIFKCGFSNQKRAYQIGCRRYIKNNFEISSSECWINE